MEAAIRVLEERIALRRIQKAEMEQDRHRGDKQRAEKIEVQLGELEAGLETLREEKHAAITGQGAGAQE